MMSYLKRIIEFTFLQIKNLFGSFNNAPEGYSKRALSAFVAIGTGIYITIHSLPENTLLHALYAWQLFALLCLGLITIPQLIEILNKKNEIKPPTDSDSTPK